MNLRRILGGVLTVGLLAGVLAVNQPEPAEAAPGLPFDPGYIIADAVFFDGGAMSAPEIQTFLNSKVPTCQSGYVCLKDYRQATPTIAADEYCSGYAGHANETAAQMIAKVAQSCGISPKVLLVTLQKEQSLVLHTWPSSWRYQSAMGFACPDTAPCDSAFGGFIYQVYYAARQFKRYAALPTRYNYQAGRVNRILFHPNATCGAADVFIRNQATAGLYNYTPYQPNAASLAAGSGTGDACSSYGNRNFWRFFWDWFGDPTLSAPLVKATGDNRIFLVSDGVKYHVTSWQHYTELARLGAFTEVSPSYVSSLADGGVATRLVSNPAGRISVLSNGALHWFPTCASMLNFGYPTCGGAGIVRLSDGQYNSFPTGINISNTVNGTDGAFLTVTAGVLKEYLTAGDRTAAGFNAPAPTLVNEALSLATYGTPALPPTALVTNRATNVQSLVVSGVAHPIEAGIAPAVASTGRLRDASMAKLTVGAPISAYMRTEDGRVVWLQADGAREIPQARLRDSSNLSVIPDSILALWPVQPAMPSGVMVKAPTSNAIWVVTDDGLRHVKTWDLAVALAGGTFPQPVSMPQSAIDAHNDRGAMLQPGSLVRTPSSNRIFYIAGGSARAYVPSFALTSAAGANGWSMVDESWLAGYTDLGVPFGFGFVCADGRYVAAGGSVHKVPQNLESSYPSALLPLDALGCSMLRIGTPAGSFISAPDGRVYKLEGGQKRHVSTWARWMQIRGGESWLPVSHEFANQIPTGAPI